jgi:hypothetical protein
MRWRRATCSVCLGEFALNRHGQLAKHGKPESCPGSKFPHLGDDTLGLHWAVDHLASRLAQLRDELMIHRMRPMLQDAADVLRAHGVVPPSSPITLAHERDQSWIKREAALVAAVRDTEARLDRLTAALAEWEPTPPIESVRPIIHLRALWRERAGTEVPWCWRDAIRHPRRDFILTDLCEDVTCDGCKSYIESVSSFAK